MIAWKEVSHREGRFYKRCKKTFGGDGYVDYLNHHDGFTFDYKIHQTGHFKYM